MVVILAAAALAQAAAVTGSHTDAASAPTDQANPPSPPANKWIAHTSDDRCWLIRGADAPEGAVFVISRIPGNERSAVWFVNPSWRRSPIYLPRKVEIALDRGEPIKAEPYFFSPQPGMIHGPLEQARVGFNIDDRAVLARLAEASALRVSEKGKEIARTDLPAMTKALSALAACETEALQSWGIDAAAWRSLRSTPRPITKWSDVLKDVDYPRSAIHEKAQGNVLMRLTIDASGTPVECWQILGTGNEKLDGKSCTAIGQKARFEPAVDANGQPVAAPYVTEVRWRIRR